MKSQYPIPLADAVRRHQAQYRLDDSQLERLLAMQQATTTDSSKPSTNRVHVSPSRHWRWWISAGMLSVFTVAFLLGTLAVSLLAPVDDRPVLARIADEVATNHLHLKPVEVAGSDLEALRAYFTRLDFRPIDTTLPASADAELLGGRYCSIQGGIAAQLRLRGRDGQLKTLYETRYDAKLHGPVPNRTAGDAPIRLSTRGISVVIWREHGVLFALTGD